MLTQRPGSALVVQVVGQGYAFRLRVPLPRSLTPGIGRAVRQTVAFMGGTPVFHRCQVLPSDRRETGAHSQYGRTP
jgi:hypothetical protein